MRRCVEFCYKFSHYTTVKDIVQSLTQFVPIGTEDIERIYAMKIRNVLIGFSAAVLMVFGIVSANAKSPAALIIDSANVSPAPTAYSEVSPGTTYNLGKDGQLTFVHYGLCKEVSITGGKVTLEAKNFKRDGGKVTKESAQPCPQQLSLAASTAVAGGVVMRGNTATPEVTPDAKLMLVGKSAGEISSAKVMDSEKAATNMNFDAATRKITSASPLKEGAYTLVLQNANGKAVAEWSFKVARQAQAGTVIVQVQ